MKTKEERISEIKKRIDDLELKIMDHKKRLDNHFALEQYNEMLFEAEEIKHCSKGIESLKTHLSFEFNFEF